MKYKLDKLKQLKLTQTPISVLTCYDYPTAVLLENGGLDAIIMGDSVGTNVLGYSSEQEVTLADILHHTQAVARGLNNTILIADCPYNTYNSPEQALETARSIMQAGADAVKLEGYHPEIVKKLKSHAIPIIGHLGLLPQTHTKKSVQATTKQEASLLLTHALDLEKQGIEALILELIPEEVAQSITQKLCIPTIGIAAGRYCNGQVQIIQDILGLHSKPFRHIKQYATLNKSITKAITHYIHDIKHHQLLDESHSFHITLNDKKKDAFQ